MGRANLTPVSGKAGKAEHLTAARSSAFSCDARGKHANAGYKPGTGNELVGFVTAKKGWSKTMTHAFIQSWILHVIPIGRFSATSFIWRFRGHTSEVPGPPIMAQRSDTPTGWVLPASRFRLGNQF